MAGGDVFGVYDGGRRLMEGMMARKSRLTRVAVGIGSAIGRADRKAHQVAKAGLVAKKELENISKQVDGLKRQLQRRKAVEARAAIGDRGKVLRVPRAAGSMAKAICVGMAFSLAAERNRSPDFTSGETRYYISSDAEERRYDSLTSHMMAWWRLRQQVGKLA